MKKQVAWSWENERTLVVWMAVLVAVLTLVWVFFIGGLWIAGGMLWYVGLIDVALYAWTIWNNLGLYRNLSKYRSGYRVG